MRELESEIHRYPIFALTAAKIGSREAAWRSVVGRQRVRSLSQEAENPRWSLILTTNAGFNYVYLQYYGIDRTVKKIAAAAASVMHTRRCICRRVTALCAMPTVYTRTTSRQEPGGKGRRLAEETAAARAGSGQKTKSVRLKEPPSQSMRKKPAQAQGGCMATREALWLMPCRGIYRASSVDMRDWFVKVRHQAGMTVLKSCFTFLIHQEVESVNSSRDGVHQSADYKSYNITYDLGDDGCMDGACDRANAFVRVQCRSPRSSLLKQHDYNLELDISGRQEA
eukprot:6202066-Pleurochrysis_carterae.AAC.2